MMAFWKKASGAEEPSPPSITLPPSRLMSELLKSLGRRATGGQSPRVLIAGPPSGTTIETFHAAGCRVQVAGDDAPADAPLPNEERSIDLVVGFDLLDLLDQPAARKVAAEWARVIRPAGRLYLLARHDRKTYPPPWRFDVLEDGTLRLTQLAEGPRDVHLRQNREIEELVRPLALSDIFLRRDGLREIVCRRQ